MKSVTMSWAEKNVNKINLIDIRTPEEFNHGFVKGSKNIPMIGLLENPQLFLDKENIFYIMCRSGNRSSRTISELEKKGYKNLINVTGGYLLATKENTN